MDFDRGFSAGSRQAPDPHDQYLERENYYRKHTPRDASSLFRCISEQLFDTQNYYRRIRDECCVYMRRNRNYFESHVDGDFDEYMQNMQHFRTRGTLLELRALAYRYQRNVILFEPYTLGNSFIQQPQFGQSPAFLVFVAPDYHFDTVYTREEIEDSAFSQSLVYETLYKDVFQLPDVGYAVERMLHDQLGARLTAIEAAKGAEEEDQDTDGSDEEASESEDDREDENKLCLVPVGAVTEDGREFVFDGKRETKCILEDYRMCHFHNEAFDEFLNSLQAAGDANNNNISGANNLDRFNRRREDSMLKAGDVSCVRQLLNAGITPFPYKVAKALDPNIYRNIEFDVWSELRKLARSKYLYKRFISVGDKCFIRLNENKEPVPFVGSGGDKRHPIVAGGGGDNENNHHQNNNNKRMAVANNPASKVYVGHVQHIERYTNMYHVYVEELRERLVVNGNTLRSCPSGSSNPRDFGMYGNGGQRVFNRFRELQPQSGKYPRQGYYNSAAPGSGGTNNLPYAARQFMRNNHMNPYARNGGFYRHSYHQYQHQYAYNRNKRFANNNNTNSNANSDDDDVSLMKKQAAIMDSDPFHGELEEKKYSSVCGIYNETTPHVNIKELLCSTYYYAESAKYFQYQDIIAMPAFITTNKNPDGGSTNNNHNHHHDEQRNNKENLKRSNNNTVENQDKSGNNVDYDPFNNNVDLELPTIADDSVQPPLSADDPQLQQPPHQLTYEPYHVVASVGETLATGLDPNTTIYATTGNGQFYASGAPGTGATYYMPATTMDPYYNTIYRNGAVSQATAVGTPYYCNYVYSNATGSMQTMTPYLLANGGAAGAMAMPSQMDGQLIPIQAAIRRRDLLCTETPVNVNATASYSVKGNDLPMNDMGSLRFYYNLGVQCFGYLASLQGAQNALNSLQFGDVAQQVGVGGGGSLQAEEREGEILGGAASLATPPIVSASVVQSPNSYAPGANGGVGATGGAGTGGLLTEVTEELKTLTVEGANGSKRNHSTSSELTPSPAITATGAQPTRNSTPASTVAQSESSHTGSTSTTATTTSTTTATGGGGGNSGPGRNFQGPGFRRPPFNNNNNNSGNNMGNSRGGYGGGRHQYNNNNYRGNAQNQSQQQNHQQGGGGGGGSGGNSGSGGNVGKEGNYRGPGNYYNNYYNRRNGPNVPGGRFNNNNNTNNFNSNNNMGHRKPLNSTGSSSNDGGGGNRAGSNNNSNSIPDEKSAAQSPFQGNNNASNVANQRHGQSPSPAATKGHYNESGVATGVGQGPYLNSQQGHQQQQQQLHGSEDGMNHNPNAIYGGNHEGAGVLAQNQMQPMNYFGGGQQFAFSGPPPHLPPPFGNTGTVNQVMAGQQPQPHPQQQQMMGLAPMTNMPQQQQQQPPPPQMYNSPFYTYTTYYPVDGGMVMGQGGMLTAAATGGDGSAGMAGNASTNMIIQQMPYIASAAPASPYNGSGGGAPQNQHLMGVNTGIPQIGTPPAQQMYYPSISGGEPVTPIMQSPAPGQMGSQQAGWGGAAMQDGTIPWSSSTGGTPGNTNSGPSSGIGSTESSPPYGSGTGGSGHGSQQSGGMVYANQSAAYTYSYPPPPHNQAQQQQHVWYAHPQHQTVVGPQATAVTGGSGGGGGGVAPGTPVTVKVDGKS